MQVFGDPLKCLVETSRLSKESVKNKQCNFIVFDRRSLRKDTSHERRSVGKVMGRAAQINREYPMSGRFSVCTHHVSLCQNVHLGGNQPVDGPQLSQKAILVDRKGWYMA